MQLTAGRHISIDLTNIPAGADYDLVLYDTNKNQLEVSKNLGQDPEHIGPIAVSKSGRYYIRIFMRVKSSSALNTYVFQVNTS